MNAAEALNMRNIELKIGRAPDYVMMIGQTTIMHQVVITVEEAGQSSREIISHASLFSLIRLVRAYIHAKIPSVRLLPHTKHLTRCEDKARELTITCDI